MSRRSPPHTTRALGNAVQDNNQMRSESCIRLHSGHGSNLGKYVQKGGPGLQQGLMVEPPHPADYISRSGCHLRAVCAMTGENAWWYDIDFRERAAIFDLTFRGARSLPHTSWASKFATQDNTRARDLNDTPGYTQDMEAVSLPS